MTLFCPVCPIHQRQGQQLTSVPLCCPCGVQAPLSTENSYNYKSMRKVFFRILSTRPRFKTRFTVYKLLGERHVDLDIGKLTHSRKNLQTEPENLERLNCRPTDTYSVVSCTEVHYLIFTYSICQISCCVYRYCNHKVQTPFKTAQQQLSSVCTSTQVCRYI